MSGLVFHWSGFEVAVFVLLEPDAPGLLVANLLALVFMSVPAVVEFLKNIITRSCVVFFFLLSLWVDLPLCLVELWLMFIQRVRLFLYQLWMERILIGSVRLSNNTSWFVHVIPLWRICFDFEAFFFFARWWIAEIF